MGSSVAQAHNTGFGHCYLMVAVPEVTVSSLLIPVIEFKKFHLPEAEKVLEINCCGSCAQLGGFYSC